MGNVVNVVDKFCSLGSRSVDDSLQLTHAIDTCLWSQHIDSITRKAACEVNI